MIDRENFLESWSTADEIQRGRLIVMCGFDGSGKTTQVELLADRLREDGRDVLITKQPTERYRNDSSVRGHIDSGEQCDMMHLALLSATDRRWHVVNVVLPALKDGKIVICDRYLFSAVSYFILRGLDPNYITSINRKIPKPALAVYLSLPTIEIVRRLSARDRENLKYEEKAAQNIDLVTGAFERMCDMDIGLTRFNGAQERMELSADIYERVQATLGCP